MSPEELEHLTAHIEKIIKLTVNGKIDRLTDRVENYIKTDDEWKEKVIYFGPMEIGRAHV